MTHKNVLRHGESLVFLLFSIFYACIFYTYTGCCELVMRIAFGYCIDKFHVDKLVLWTFGALVCFVAGIITSLSESLVIKVVLWSL